MIRCVELFLNIASEKKPSATERLSEKREEKERRALITRAGAVNSRILRSFFARERGTRDDVFCYCLYIAMRSGNYDKSYIDSQGEGI